MEMKFWVVLSITCIYLNVFFQVVGKDDFHAPFVCLLHFRRSFSQKLKKASRVIIVCSG